MQSNLWLDAEICTDIKHAGFNRLVIATEGNTLQLWILISSLYGLHLTRFRGDFWGPSPQVRLVALVTLMNYRPAQLKHVWYYPIPGCVLQAAYESLISSNWFSLCLSPSLCSPPTPPFPLQTLLSQSSPPGAALWDLSGPSVRRRKG